MKRTDCPFLHRYCSVVTPRYPQQFAKQDNNQSPMVELHDNVVVIQCLVGYNLPNQFGRSLIQLAGCASFATLRNFIAQ